MRRIIAFLCFALLVSSFFTSCDFLLDIGTEEPAVPSADDDSNTLLGFPSNAVSGESQIVEHGAYTLLYDYETLLPVWVSWHLDDEDTGTGRDADFRGDPDVPQEYRLNKDDYTNCGYDRGHICPNADRSGDDGMQQESFYMTNIVPQNGDNNQGVWRELEEFIRSEYIDNGKEAYIIAGPAGVGGYDETYVDENGEEQTRRVGTDKYEEGPWAYERNGKYYLVYAAGGIPEHLSYSMSDSPTGPWKYCGQIMDTPEGSFTTHPGIVDFKGRSFIFYHNGGLKGGSGFRRSVCVEEFTYNEDGTIPHIPITKEGVTEAVTHLSPYIRQEAETIGMSSGVRTAQDEKRGVYLDSLDMSDYVKVKSVDFGTTGAKSVMLAVRKVKNPGLIQVCIDTQSNVVGTVNVPESGEWTEVRADLDETITGIHDVYFRFRATAAERKDLMQFDYWQFFTNTATGVADALSDAPSQEDGATYDLSGRKVEQPGKGVYIRDGKKFLNRP